MLHVRCVQNPGECYSLSVLDGERMHVHSLSMGVDGESVEVGSI